MSQKTIRINDVHISDGDSIDLDVEDVRLAVGSRLTEKPPNSLPTRWSEPPDWGVPRSPLPGSARRSSGLACRDSYETAFEPGVAEAPRPAQ
jgi:hypothetical protein